MFEKASGVAITTYSRNAINFKLFSVGLLAEFIINYQRVILSQT